MARLPSGSFAPRHPRGFEPRPWSPQGWGSRRCIRTWLSASPGRELFRMIKSQLVQRISHASPHLRQRDVEKVVKAILTEITTAMARGDRVELRGFGTFSVKTWRARTARNPRTGAVVEVQQKRFPVFRTGKEMRERVNKPAQS